MFKTLLKNYRKRTGYVLDFSGEIFFLSLIFIFLYFYLLFFLKPLLAFTSQTFVFWEGYLLFIFSPFLMVGG